MSRSSVRVQREDFSVEAEHSLMQALPGVGAIASFVGVVRADDAVESLTVESYPGMTERSLQEVADEACARWDLLDALVVHRIGALDVGERIVLVMVAARRRQEAFAACECIMDYLKTRAVLWKKERAGATERWVRNRAGDLAAARRWRAS